MIKEKYTEEEFRKKTGRHSDATLGKLPPLRQDGRNTSQRPFRLQLVKPDFQTQYMEEREMKIIAMYERQQQTALEKLRQMFEHDKYPLQRQYHSARDRYDRVYYDEKDYDSTARKTSGAVKAFPPKPDYHKRSYSLSNIYGLNNELGPAEPLKTQRLPHPFPAPSVDYPNRCDGRLSRRGSGRQLPENQGPIIPMPSSFREPVTRGRGRDRESQWLEGKMEEDQKRLGEQIRRKEIVLQEKLQRVVEELGRIQREKYTSAGMMERRERIEVEQERGKWEKEKERRESEKAAYAEQERWERVREKRDREKNRERDRRERELNRERGRRERVQELDRLKEEERERDRARERGWERAQRRRPQEKHHVLQRGDCERNGSSSGGSIPPEVQHRHPMHIVEETHRQVLSSDNSSEAVFELLPCKLCHRNFAADRLEKHHKVCEKVQHSTRKVFDSSKHRAKGTVLEEYMKTNSRLKTPELKISNWRQKHETFIWHLRQARMPVQGASRKQLVMDNPDYKTCPHCTRHFAPGPAERHIPMCQNIKSRPPPPRRQAK
ncbi:hypothetical protein AAFF_G00012070 [Aldrovandia affinis]|uniref:C2HC/C3H-type domain-containing protein n=1 Tax=Aldrovandia affinis TaxID=143900 RepID=A0AAD7WI42_9TELE|nr:hypothetical protein AAFF_G00012070 [Aldrovandia affinis]